MYGNSARAEMRDVELDEMSVDEFNRKYKDTHTEIKAMSRLKSGKFIPNVNNIKHPEDRNISPNPAVKIPGKAEIEKVEAAKREDREREYFKDAFWVRKLEVLDPEAMPITKLSDIVVKMMPQKVEGKVDHSFSYADMVLTAAKNLNQLEHMEILEATSEEADIDEY